MKKVDLTGQKFGRLLVVEESAIRSGGHLHWLCECECGKRIVVLGYNLKNGNTKSCGCLRKELAKTSNLTHNNTGSRLYVAWVHMKQRCNNSKEYSYKHYGGRGIKVCDEWANSFQSFHEWAMSNGYADNLTIDRIDVNGNYCPENCRWVTFKEQQRNKRNNTRVLFNGYCKTVGAWAEEFGCVPAAVYREILKREKRVFCDSE